MAEDLDTADDTDTVAIVEDVQLSLVKEFQSADVTAGGDSETFTIVVTNDGDSDADNLVLNDIVDERLLVTLLDSGAFTCATWMSGVFAP